MKIVPMAAVGALIALLIGRKYYAAQPRQGQRAGGHPMSDATVVLVPGLRGHVEDHWQTRLAASLPGARIVPPLGPDRRRACRRGSPCWTGSSRTSTVRWSSSPTARASWSRCTGPGSTAGRRSSGALLATPPALADELPPEYPSIRRLRDHGWLPIPRRPLPFPSILAASTDDPLGNPVRLRAMARAWGSRWHSLGAVGHLNPASGYGEWPGRPTG